LRHGAAARFFQYSPGGSRGAWIVESGAQAIIEISVMPTLWYGRAFAQGRTQYRK
jgi:hypothetical protein